MINRLTNREAGTLAILLFMNLLLFMALLGFEHAKGYILPSTQLSIVLPRSHDTLWECACKPSQLLDRFKESGVVSCTSAFSSDACQYATANCYCHEMASSVTLLKRSGQGCFEEIESIDPETEQSQHPPVQGSAADLNNDLRARWTSSIHDMPELKGYIEPTANEPLIDAYVNSIASRNGIDYNGAAALTLEEMAKDADLIFNAIKEQPRVIEPGTRIEEFLPESARAEVGMPQYLVDSVHLKLLEHILGESDNKFEAWTRTPIPSEYAEFVDSLVSPVGRNSQGLDLLKMDQLKIMSKNTRKIISQRWLELIAGLFSHETTTREFTFHENPIEVTFRGFTEEEVELFAEGVKKQSEYLKKINEVLADEDAIDDVDDAIQKHFGDDGHFSIVLSRYLKLRDIKALTLWKSKANSLSTSAFSILSDYMKGWAPESLGADGKMDPNGGWSDHPLVWFPQDSEYFETNVEHELDLGKVLIHENTHYLFNTIDEAYGYKDCVDLAARDPETAIKNADSYSWFVHEIIP